MERCLEPELLDSLAKDDPRAIRSRADLRRINVVLGHVGIVRRLLKMAHAQTKDYCLVELGAGDGTLLLKTVRSLRRHRQTGKVMLVDRQPVADKNTLQQFAALGWPAEVVEADVFDWLSRSVATDNHVMVANLFLHHFDNESLKRLFALASRQCRFFAGCEPRRNSALVNATRLLKLLGCSAVTLHDAMASVRAGFCDRELSSLWPDSGGWQMQEHAAGYASHTFVAARNASL